MYRKIEDFVSAWETESAATQKLLDAIDDRSLEQPVLKGHRTLARIAWHIVTTVSEMMAKTGLAITSVSPDAPVPGKASEIQRAYASVASELLKQIKTN